MHNIVFPNQQGPVYASQAGTMQPYDQSQYGNNGYGNNNGQYGNNQYGWNQQNNGQYNNWQNNNQYGRNNNTAVNNTYGYQNNNNASNTGVNNPFLMNYARRTKQFSASVYKMAKNGKLYKTKLDDKILKKAIVIFFGDWCPNCAKFLSGLSKYLKQLVDSGIKIIFIGVPSVEKLQDWRDPSASDYQESRNKLRSFNILLDQLDPNGYDAAGNPNNKSKKVELVLLGENDVLDRNAIDSLPTMLAVNDGKEQFRGSSDNSLDIVNFENSTAMKQFLDIWKEEDDDEDDEIDEIDEDENDDEDEEECKPKKKVKSKKKNSSTKKKRSKKKNKTSITCIKENKTKTRSNNSRVDQRIADFHTRMLNKGCQCNCHHNLQQLIKIHAPQPVTPVQQPVATNTNATATVQTTVTPVQNNDSCYIVPMKKYIRLRKPVMCNKHNNGSASAKTTMPTTVHTTDQAIIPSGNNNCCCTCNQSHK